MVIKINPMMRLCTLRNNTTSRSIPSVLIVGVLLSFSMLSCRRTVTSPPPAQPAQPLSTPDSLSKTPPTPELDLPPKTPSTSAEEKVRAAQYRQLGLDYRGQGRYAEAIASLEDAVELDPQNLSGQVILGWTLHLNGQAEHALDVLQQALLQDESYVPALNALGIVYLVDGQLENAVETHTQAVTLEPDNEVGYYNLSLAYQRLGNYESAIANAQQAAGLEPSNPHPLVALAVAHWNHQDPTTAKQIYQQAIDLEPRYREAWFLDHLQQAGFSPEQIQVTDVIRQTQ